MIHRFDWSIVHEQSQGMVVSVAGPIMKIVGLKHVFLGEALVTKSGQIAIVSKLQEKFVYATHTSNEGFEVGVKIAATGQMLSITVGEKILGYVFDSLGHTYGGREESNKSENRTVFASPKDLVSRIASQNQLITGVSAIDLLVPIAKGQRELIMGNVGTGKSVLARQMLISHALAGGVGVLCLIGKQRTEIEESIAALEMAGVMHRCVVIAEPADCIATRIFLSPFTAITVAEYFRDFGEDVVVVMDDLTTHAMRYREMTLVSGDFPGRESYPVDIFWTQAQIMERSGVFNVNGVVSSITCLPILETVDGNMTGYIETNLMSMTDGHILLDSELLKMGISPAINFFLSVTRVGRQTQNSDLKILSQKTLDLIKEYENLKNFLRFGYDLNDQAKKTVQRMEKINALLNQDHNTLRTLESQMRMLTGVFEDEQK